MSKPRDIVRSLVRSAADRAIDTANRVGGLDRVRDAVGNLVRQRIPLKASTLTTVVAHLPGVESASVTAHDGALHVDVAFTDGSFLQGRLVPTRIRFAARGAKEVGFRIEPPEAARGHRVMDVVSAIGGAIAVTLWPIANFEQERNLGGAIVDRDGVDGFCIDLRTAPAVRALESKGQRGLVIELIELGELSVENGALMLQMRLPQLAV